MVNIIYGLRDPRNDVYQYIGKSTVGTKRPLRHLIKSHSPKVNDWVECLTKLGFSPIIDIIEEVEDINDLNERERYWIAYYKDINPSLLNIQSTHSIFQNIHLREDTEKIKTLFSIMSECPSLLRRERVFRHLSQKQIAERCGYNVLTISTYERGKPATLDLFLKYLNCLFDENFIVCDEQRRPYQKRGDLGVH